MKSTGTLALATWIALAGCSDPERRTMIVLDSAWNIDSARNACAEAAAWHRENTGMIARFGCQKLLSCQAMTAIAAACARDPVRQVREFEAALGEQFAQLEQCRSILLVDPASAQDQRKAGSTSRQKDVWNLGLDFSPGAPKQQWTMIHAAEQVSLSSGEGDPREIAVEVCAEVRQASSG